MQPLEEAMLKARVTFPMQVLSHHGEFTDAASRSVLADLPNADFGKFSNRLISWMLPMCCLSTALASFGMFGPAPIPKFAGIHSFATLWSHLIRTIANRGGQGPMVSCKTRRADTFAAGGGGAEKCQAKICFSFRDTGACKFGDGCKFRDVRGARAQSAGGGGGRGNSDGGSGNAGGGSSSTLVVHGGGGEDGAP